MALADDWPKCPFLALFFCCSRSRLLLTKFSSMTAPSFLHPWMKIASSAQSNRYFCRLEGLNSCGYTSCLEFGVQFNERRESYHLRVIACPCPISSRFPFSIFLLQKMLLQLSSVPFFSSRYYPSSTCCSLNSKLLTTETLLILSADGGGV